MGNKHKRHNKQTKLSTEIKGITLNQVPYFKHWGCKIPSNGKYTEDIEYRIRKAKIRFSLQKKLLHLIREKTQKNLVNSYIWSVRIQDIGCYKSHTVHFKHSAVGEWRKHSVWMNWKHINRRRKKWILVKLIEGRMDKKSEEGQESDLCIKWWKNRIWKLSEDENILVIHQPSHRIES